MNAAGAKAIDPNLLRLIKLLAKAAIKKQRRDAVLAANKAASTS